MPFEGTIFWTDRIFYDHELEGLHSLSELWPRGAPLPMRMLVSTLAFVATRRSTLRMAFGLQREIGA